MIAEEIKKLIGPEYKLEHPADLKLGDYAFHAKGKAKEWAAKINQNRPDWLEKVEVVGGFVNFYLSPKFLTEEIVKINSEKSNYGRSDKLAGQKTIVEYTDPNPFKQFHIGHLMSNAIGEAISRLIQSQGSEVKRLSYGGDVGLHVAKAMFGVLSQKEKLAEVKNKDKKEQLKFWAESYVLGSNQYEDNEEAKKEIDNLNKAIFDKADDEINRLYDWGRELSISHFQDIFKKLDTHFDRNFWESEVVQDGLMAVASGLEKNIFEKSDGAVIFRGEQYGLHTRVFINSKGIPTYEAKELGLGVKKYELFQFDKSIIITGNEQNAYFGVLLKVMDLLKPEIANKTSHVGHGMLRFANGKMSSRKGNVITGESLLEEVRNKLGERGSDEIAVAAIKYSILRQSPGKDIIFDFEKSLSFEGDSGPYLQYTCVRAKSVLEKFGGEAKGSTLREPKVEPWSPASPPTSVERLLYRFPEVIARAAAEYLPNHLVTYLTELASAYNSFYTNNQIIGSEEETYRLALTAATAQVLENGLHLLGIEVPAKM